MGEGVIALFIALGSGAWIYNKMYPRTGGQTNNAWVVAGVCTLVIFIIAYTSLKSFL